MALVLQDRVKETSSSSGTGDITLGGSIPGFRTFISCVPTASIVYYCIHNLAAGYDTEWEVGYGTFTSPDTLVRTNVYSSSNAGALVNFTAGANGLEVFITYPAEQSVFQQTNGLTEFNEGPISVVGANASPGNFSATLAQFTSNEPGYSQLYIQNQSNDANASADIVAYNEIGDGSSYFIDMGMSSSTYNSIDYPIFQENDAYLFNAGNVAGTGAIGDISRLLLGTSTANSNVVIFGGSIEANAVIATFVASTKNVEFINGVSVTNTLGANNITITNYAYAGGNIANAANNTVLVTQGYVDNAVSTGFTVHAPCIYATTTDLGTITYNNGTDGVGATITNAGTQIVLVVDGHTMNAANQTDQIRILVKNETDAGYNGIYTLTDTGSILTNWVLTRATDFDQAGSGSGEVQNNAYTFINSGATNIGTSWVLAQTTLPIVIGDTPLPFTQFASQVVYTGTAPINVSGQTIALTGVVPVANGGTNLSTFVSGSLVYANAANTISSLAIGSQYNSLVVSAGSLPSWGTIALGSSNAVSGTLGATNGGTSQSTYTLGDTLYANATNTVAKLAGNITTTKKYLQQIGDGANSAAPSWVQVAAADISGLGTMSTQNANAVAITGGSLNNVTIGGSTPNTGAFTDVNATNVTATTGSFTNVSGNGVALTAINASNITSGTIANARTTGNTANSASTIVLRDSNGSFGANIISATFSGDGSAISAINASNLSSGTVANARTTADTANSASTIVLRDSSGSFGAGNITAVSISGNGVALTSINASNITSGTIANARTTADSANSASTIVLRGSSGEFAAGAITATSISGNGIALTAINASNIASGTVGTARLATGTANSSSYLRGDSTWAVLAAPNNGTLSMGVSGTGLSGSATFTADQSSNSTFTVTINSASANGASTVVARDSGGNFSANTITANLTGNASGSAGTFTSTSQNSQFNSIGVGTAASTTAGDIRATTNITAYYSSDRQFKENIEDISDALNIVDSIGGKYFDWTEAYLEAHGGEDEYFLHKQDFGVIAQDVQLVFPRGVRTRPDGSLAVDYEKLVAVAFAAIKELKAEVAELKAR